MCGNPPAKENAQCDGATMIVQSHAIIYYLYQAVPTDRSLFTGCPKMITKMHEECCLRTDAANEKRGKRVPLFGGCTPKGLQARSGAYIRQGATICDLSSSDCRCAVSVTAEAEQ